MNLSHRNLLVAVVLALSSVARAAAGQDAAVSAKLTPEEMEAFLLKAKVLDVRDAGGGVTNSRRGTLSDGRLTHDVHIQSVDIAKPVFQAGGQTEVNFKDSYRFNIAGYRLARLLGINTVPMSVQRSINGKTAAVTWWVDDVQMDEKDRVKKQTMGPNAVRTAHQMQVMVIWDELIQNRDRNQGNILWTHDWTLWLIDHTRAFRLGKSLLRPELVVACDRDLLARMKALTEQSLAEAVGDSLSKDERAAVLTRRDLILKALQDRIAKVGEGLVLFGIERGLQPTH